MMVGHGTAWHGNKAYKAKGINIIMIVARSLWLVMVNFFFALSLSLSLSWWLLTLFDYDYDYRSKSWWFSGWWLQLLWKTLVNQPITFVNTGETPTCFNPPASSWCFRLMTSHRRSSGPSQMCRSPNLGARERGNLPSFKASCNAASMRSTALPSPLNESFSLTMTYWQPWLGMWVKWSWKMKSWWKTGGEFLVDKCLTNY